MLTLVKPWQVGAEPSPKTQWIVIAGGEMATLADSGMPVWEVVRVYRRVHSMAKLLEAFSNVDLESLETALAYAESNQDQIDHQIEDYESIVSKRGMEWPGSADVTAI